MLGLSVLFLLVLAFELWVVVPRVMATEGTPGVDFHQYQDHARRWLSGGGFYLPEQLAGPYRVQDLVPPLYPPPFLLLITPFLWLPWLLWWALPLAIIGAVILRMRPAPWSWPILAALVAWPRSFEIVLFGNPTMWIAAAAGLGAVFGWPAVAVLLKPSLLPFALIGANRRSWWLALAVAVAVSALFGPLWFDYLRALANADIGWTYSLRDIPLVGLPVVAWLARSRPAEIRSPADSEGLRTLRPPDYAPAVSVPEAPR